MPMDKSHFPSLIELKNHLQNKIKGGLLVTYKKCDNYEGMALSIMIVFDVQKSKYELDLQWMTLGLDLYGDTLQESYLYEFESLELLLEYLQIKYGIKITDIPINYKFDSSQFPDPISNASQKAEFETAWQRFQIDFKKGLFFDTSLKLVFDSNDY
jgi:hypothetical protein